MSLEGDAQARRSVPDAHAAKDDDLAEPANTLDLAGDANLERHAASGAQNEEEEDGSSGAELGEMADADRHELPASKSSLASELRGASERGISSSSAEQSPGAASVTRSLSDGQLDAPRSAAPPPQPLPLIRPLLPNLSVFDERRSSAPASMAHAAAVKKSPNIYLPWGEAPSPWSLKPPSPVRAASPWSGASKPLTPWSTTESRAKIKAVPTNEATHAYVPRKGPLAYLERCAKCNKPESAHKVVSPNQLRAAENDHLWLLRDLLVDSQFTASRRVKVLRDVAASLRDMHKQGRCYGQAITPTSVLLDHLCHGLLRRPVPEAKKLDPYSSKHEARAKDDVARFGRLARQVLAGLVLPSEQSILDATSLGALCEQCLDEDPGSRPDAEGLYEWLDSVLSELAPIDDDFSPKTSRFRGFVDIVSSHMADEHDELEGYDSDDSFFPIPEKVKLSSEFDLPVGSNPSTPTGMKRSGSVESKLNSFLQTMGGSSSAGSSSSAALDKKQAISDASLDDGDAFAQARRRRRSLETSPSSNASRPKRLIRLSSAAKLNFRKSWTTQHGRKRSLEVPSPSEVAARFDKQERLQQDEASAIVLQAESQLRKEPNVVNIPEGSKVLVFGDVHGQYYDLRQALKQAQYSLDEPDERKLLMLGDYVDRGAWSCEVWLFLLSLKVARPNDVMLLRGNHECSAVVSFFGFKEECETKYGTPMFHRCVNCFQAMPLAAMLTVSPGETWLCCHGGLSPRLESMADVETVDRFAEPGMNGLFCDLLWADPAETQDDFTANPSRGCSVRFSEAAATRFLNANGLAGIIRGHEVVEDGVLYQFSGRLITVFSAPNYCGRYGNRAAYLVVDEDEMVAHRFDPAQAQPEPLEFESVSREVNTSIARTCPYMPTTLQGFVSRALELWSANAVMAANEFSTADGTDAAAGDHHPRPSRLSESRTSRLAHHETRDSTRDSVDDYSSAAPGSGSAEASPFVEARKKLARAFRSIMPTRRFQTAKLADGINEAHPSLTHLKLQSAEFQLRMWEKKSTDTAVDMARDVNGALKFSEGELRNLQLLFMLVDRSDDGLISANELVAWSQTEGEYVSPEDAQRVLEAVDGDHDGSIGLDDWLVFATACKEEWMHEAAALEAESSMQEPPSDTFE